MSGPVWPVQSAPSTMENTLTKSRHLSESKLICPSREFVHIVRLLEWLFIAFFNLLRRNCTVQKRSKVAARTLFFTFISK